MTTLSELFPAGGGGNTADFVASGTLPNGKPVILKANGQVEVVGFSTTSQSIPAGSEYVFNTGSRARNPIMAFDPNTEGKFVIAFKDMGNSSYSVALAATVSGTTISFGSETVFYSGSMGLSAIEFDPNTAGKFLIAYQDEYNSGTGTSLGRAIVGTLSGTSVSFGTAVTFEAADVGDISMSFDPNTSGKFALAFKDIGNSDRGTMLIGTLSGTSVSFGSPVIFNTDSSTTHSVCYDPLNAGKFVVTYNRGTLRAKVGSVSGTTPSFGTEVVFSSENSNTFLNTAIDNITGKTLSVYYTDGYAKAIVGTISGTSISFATAVNWKNSLTYKMIIAADPLNTGSFIVNYSDGADSNKFKTIVCSVSGTTPSFGSPITIVNSNSYSNYISSKFDPVNSGKFVTTYDDVGNSEYGTSAVGQTTVSLTNLTSTNFLGTATAAYTNGQTASIMLKGGISDNQTSLTAGSTYYVQTDGTFATSAGTPSVLAGEAVSATSLLLNGLATPDEIPSQTSQSGKFLTTNGSAASWGTVAPAGLVLLSTVTASSASTSDIETTFDSTYDSYVIVAVGVTVSASNCILGFQMKLGGSYSTNNYKFHTGTMQSSSAGYQSMTSNGGTMAQLSNELASSSQDVAGAVANYTINISNPSSTSFGKTAYWQGQALDRNTSGGAAAVSIGSCYNTATSALTGIRFLADSGTISGTFRLYGIAK